MGIAILWVMLFHSSIKAPEHPVLRLLWYILICNGGGLGVNIFFILSGFGLMFSHNKQSCCESKAAVLEFYKRRCLRLFIPYSIVAGIFFAIIDIWEKRSILLFLKDFLCISFFESGDRTYWFIAAIFGMYLIFPLCMKLCEKVSTVRGLTLLLTFTFVLDILIEFVNPLLYGRLEIILLRAPCFFLGCLLGQIAIEKKTWRRWLYLILGVGAAAIIVWGAAIYKGVLTIRLERYLFIPLAVSLTVVFAQLGRMLGQLGKPFSFLGSRSLELYLIHIPIYHCINSLCGQLNPYVSCVVVIIISVCLSELLHGVCRAAVSIKRGIK